MQCATACRNTKIQSSTANQEPTRIYPVSRSRDPSPIVRDTSPARTPSAIVGDNSSSPVVRQTMARHQPEETETTLDAKHEPRERERYSSPLRAYSAATEKMQKGISSATEKYFALRVPSRDEGERQLELSKVYREFDLAGDGSVGAEELLVLGQTRRKLGQKAGEWTAQNNANLMQKIGTDQFGNLPEDNFVQYFAGSLATDAAEFGRTMQQFMQCATLCRKNKMRLSNTTPGAVHVEEPVFEEPEVPFHATVAPLITRNNGDFEIRLKTARGYAGVVQMSTLDTVQGLYKAVSALTGRTEEISGATLRLAFEGEALSSSDKSLGDVGICTECEVTASGALALKLYWKAKQPSVE